MPRSRSRSPRRERRRSGSRERRRSRSGSRERERRRRSPKARSPKARRRSRSPKPPRRRSPPPRRARSASSSPARPAKSESRPPKPPAKKELTEEDLEGRTEEEIEMMKIMGFAEFDSTKGRKVEGSVNAYAINVSQKRKYRQYMNRKGGFNRPLDFVA